MRLFPIIIGSLAVAFVATIGIGVSHNVDTTPTAADAEAMQAIMGHKAELISEGRPHDFEAEIALILAVQDAVLDAAPIDEGLPLGSAREPTDLIAAGHGLCYDRSRAIEKLLRLAGLETRHVAVYSTVETGSALTALMTPQVPSHAVSEVQTQRGWLLVDSNRRWISLTADGRPLAADAVQSIGGLASWAEQVPDSIDGIFQRPFTFVYGLYSRHGLFFPPFNLVPDVNWFELTGNL